MTVAGQMLETYPKSLGGVDRDSCVSASTPYLSRLRAMTMRCTWLVPS